MLHSQTTLILTALMFLALPFMAWLALRSAGGAAVLWWCGGGWLAGTGIVLMGLRPWLPEWLSYQLANTCVLASLLLWSQSLRIWLDRGWSPWGVLLGVLVCAAGYSALLAWSTPVVRGLSVRLALGTLAFYTALWAWRLARRQRSGNALTIALTYLLLALVLTGQAAMTAGKITTPSPFSNTWDASVLALTALLTAMVAHFCYVGMVLEQAAQERVQAQLAEQASRQTRLLGAQLQRMDRRRRMAILSGSLAHELNQPLTAALMNAQLAERQWVASPASTPLWLSLLEQVQAGIDRTVQILQRIRQGQGLPREGLQALDLRRVLEQSLEQVEPEMRALGVALRLQCAQTPMPCRGDELALSQALVNLLRNAVQAMAGMPERQLSLSCQQGPDWVELRVRDTGPGLGGALSERWGEPMLSTKSEGLGMGLAISRDIVQQHRGELLLHNHPDGGAQAVLRLPRRHEEGAP